MEQGTRAELEARSRRLEVEMARLEAARQAASRAEMALARAVHHLGSAGFWGWLDILFGGWIVTLRKRQAMSEGRVAYEQAQAEIETLTSRLKGLAVEADPLTGASGAGGVMAMADYLLDSPPVDALVQLSNARLRRRALAQGQRVTACLVAIEERLRELRKEHREVTEALAQWGAAAGVGPDDDEME